jgi:hypothetical protein
MTQYSGKVIRKTPVTPTQASASGVWKLNEQAAAIRNNTWPVAGVPDPISRSVRLRSSASAYFNRTPALNGNVTTWTWSGWIKRGTLGAAQILFGSGNGTTTGTYIQLTSSNEIEVYYYSNTFIWRFITSALYRDPSAWYNVCVAYDSTNATAGDRMRLYVNGVRLTAFGTSSTVSLNQNTSVNTNAFPHYISAPGAYVDGYLTEINFIDGQALTPSSFGTTDPLTGAWIPMQYTGSYGTNGFYLDFKDNTSTTTLGLDYSGNSNNWTANNVSLTAGSTYDSMLDVPTPWIGYSATTDTSAVTRGNYPTWNPLTAGGLVTFSEANLRALSTSASAPFNIESTIKTATTGKWYAEITVAAGVNNPVTGIGNNPATSATNTDQYAGYRTNGTYVTSGMGASSSGTPATFTTNDVIGIAYDVDAGTLSFYKNGTLQAGGFTGITAGNYSFIVRKDSASGDGGYLNCGQRPFSYSVPTGFKTLCATNLPTPTIVNGASYMAATTYAGNGTSSNTVSNANFQPDMVWVKNRTSAASHILVDAVRGVSNVLTPQATTAEQSLPSYITSFTSTGFTIGTSATDLNASSNNYVAWQWRANGTPAVTNTSGSITSTVSANTTAGFSVVTYTGNGSSGATIGHGLGVAPRFFIVKKRNAGSSDWRCYHAAIDATASNNYFIDLNSTAARVNAVAAWNNSGPTSTTFTVGNNTNTNGSGDTFVAYCFAAVAGYSAFGSYTGNGSSSGPFVYLGFRPRWILIKRSDTSGTSWCLVDSSRSPNNTSVNGGMQNTLFPNSSNAEDTGADICDGLSNGFRFYQGASSFNANGGTYIYAAFAENPFKYSNAR